MKPTIAKPQNATSGRKMAADYAKQFGHRCEDCDEESYGRRRRCKNCELLVCGWCYNHIHDLPSHAGRIVLRSGTTMNHRCRESHTCCCSVTALEPNEYCPIHGAGHWPPRCGECGKFIHRVMNFARYSS